jgi:hypothetical protein
MQPAFTDRAIADLQNVVQLLGKPVQFFEAGSVTGRTIRARVSYGGAQELANSIEQYPMRVSVDSRDFTTRPPQKGDWFVIDNARRGIEAVSESHMGGVLVKYVCGVRG